MSKFICKDLSIGYENQTLIDDISFEICEGDYVSIVGENGAGKSTLMKTMLGLISPLDGKIKLEDLRKDEIGYLPQQELIKKDFPATVKEIVLSGFLNSAKLRPFYNKKEKEIAKRNMEILQIGSLENKSYSELSGGQKQRVLLARALSATSKILFLDEPIAGLDPIVTKELYSIIEKINKELNITIIMISHDLEEAIKYSNKVIYIGKKFFFGPTSEFINSDYYKRSKGDEEWTFLKN